MESLNAWTPVMFHCSSTQSFPGNFELKSVYTYKTTLIVIRRIKCLKYLCDHSIYTVIWKNNLFFTLWISSLVSITKKASQKQLSFYQGFLILWMCKRKLQDFTRKFFLYYVERKKMNAFFKNVLTLCAQLKSV